MKKRFRTIQIFAAGIFVLTVVAMIFAVRGGVFPAEQRDIRIALLYVFVAIVIALSMAVVIACHVILKRLKTGASEASQD